MNTNNEMKMRDEGIKIISDEISNAVAASKCHKCGCLQKTVETFETMEVVNEKLAPLFAEAKEKFLPQEYDCLGCAVCFPAIAANAFSEAFPNLSSDLDLCPADEPEEREGWPPLPGDYKVRRFSAPVAICTLNSEELYLKIAGLAPEGMAIVGKLNTENLGIEHIIKNITANPNIRFLIICGEDTQQAIGHLPGQSLSNLFHNGIDERKRIVGAKGKRPFLKNISEEQIQTFLEQVKLIDLAGEKDEIVIMKHLEQCLPDNPGIYNGKVFENKVKTIRAKEPERLTIDPSGFFVVYPDYRNKLLIVEHYTTGGVLNCVIEGTTPGAVYIEIIKRELISRLDHAAYLGRELARAHKSLETGEIFVQDKAPGEVLPEEPVSSCGSKSKC